jgi:hypothetical protein
MRKGRSVSPFIFPIKNNNIRLIGTDTVSTIKLLRQGP